MNNNALFLLVIAGAAFLFAAFNSIQFLTKRSRTAQTSGTVISITQPNPETAKARNSKWAILTYRVNGTVCTSQNRIQVPMTAQTGSVVTVRYDREHPEVLYSFSPARILISTIIAAGCIAAAFSGLF